MEYPKTPQGSGKGFLSAAARLALHPSPLRAVLFRRLLNKLWPSAVGNDSVAVQKPAYRYSMRAAAKLARSLGHRTVSVIEFGVAGGNGLLAMERHAADLEKELGIAFELYGFDTGAGLPPPEDYRDLPYHWKNGFFRMDPVALQAKLSRSRLVLGDVRDTCGNFFSRYKPAPIGFISFDLDYYSSTMNAFQLFEGGREFFLPRLMLYFDDVIGDDTELYNEFTGELLAIADFNLRSEDRKIAPCRHLVAKNPLEVWRYQIYSYHDFRHPQYNQFISQEDQQLCLHGAAHVLPSKSDRVEHLVTAGRRASLSTGTEG
ncbi:MAG: hypothetical protein JO336_19200 [Acidobacteriia bacterium]|nr:hypothetical protein [Terriglobia bacterium]